MNRFETWFCGSPFWRNVTRRRLLPWMIEGSELGNHVLELGAGLGATTEELRSRAARVTSLEYSHAFAASLGGRVGGTNACVVQGDAATLPFADGTFSSVVAILVFHHLRSNELQDCAFAEAWRVLRPGGALLALDIEDGWLNRVVHIRSTFVPLAIASVQERLTAAGFTRVSLVSRHGGFRIQATRARSKSDRSLLAAR